AAPRIRSARRAPRADPRGDAAPGAERVETAQATARARGGALGRRAAHLARSPAVRRDARGARGAARPPARRCLAHAPAPPAGEPPALRLGARAAVGGGERG